MLFSDKMTMEGTTAAAVLPSPQNIIYYEQIFKRERQQLPHNYYNPQMVLADKPFELKPDEEILVVIDGCGYRYNDNCIYQLNFTSTAATLNGGGGEQFNNEGSTTTSTTTTTTTTATTATTSCSMVQQPQQLCLLVKNSSTEHTILVGYQTPLTWLLDMPRVTSKLCYCVNTELTKIKLGLHQLSSKNSNNNNKMYPIVEDKTIVIIHKI
jgi:hypothetical protein